MVPIVLIVFFFRSPLPYLQSKSVSLCSSHPHPSAAGTGTDLCPPSICSRHSSPPIVVDSDSSADRLRLARLHSQAIARSSSMPAIERYFRPVSQSQAQAQAPAPASTRIEPELQTIVHTNQYSSQHGQDGQYDADEEQHNISGNGIDSTVVPLVNMRLTTAHPTSYGSVESSSRGSVRWSSAGPSAVRGVYTPSAGLLISSHSVTPPLRRFPSLHTVYNQQYYPDHPNDTIGTDLKQLLTDK